MSKRPLLFFAALVAGLVWPFSFAGAGGSQPVPPVIIHESVWDAGELDSWSAFSVRITNTANAEFRGELWLVGEPAPAPATGLPVQPGSAEPPAGDPDSPVPSIRSPLVLEAGVERVVSVMAPVGGTAYKAEVRDRAGRLIFAGQPRRALAPTAFNVGLLTDRRSGDALFQVGSQLAISVTRRFRSAVDFPRDVLSLAGLEAIVIADFDSSALDELQLDALANFVATGGTLIVTGGEAGERTLAKLPDEVVPLRPAGTVVASLAPLADLAPDVPSGAENPGGSTTAVAGELRSGRVLVGALGGPPLVIESRYGSGRVVQLTYDPFVVADEQRATAGKLGTLPWSIALVRAASKAASATAQGAAPGNPQAIRPAPAWAVLTDAPGPEPKRGGPLGWLFVAYPFVVGATTLALARSRGKTALTWVAVPALAAVFALVSLPLEWGLRGNALVGDQLTIEQTTPGGGPTLVESFHRLVPSASGAVEIALAGGTLATTASAPPSREVLPALPVLPSRESSPLGPVGDVVELEGRTEVALRHLIGWDVRRLHTLGLEPPRGSIEAKLRLESGRLVGTVTNQGDRRVRRLRAGDGRGTMVEVAALVRPGATVDVDVPFAVEEPAAATVAPGMFGATTTTVPRARPRLRDRADVEEAFVEGAAASVGPTIDPGDLVLVGIVPSSPPPGGKGSVVRSHGALRALVKTVALESADDFVLGYGIPQAFCCGVGNASVFDLQLPPGMAGPFALQSTAPIRGEIHDWTTGRWRPIPPEPGAKPALAPEEVRDGVVRIRGRGDLRVLGLRAMAAK